MASSSELIFVISTHAQGAFEALLVEAVDGGQDLEELVDALLVIQVGELLEGLLDQLPEGLSLRRERERERETE